MPASPVAAACPIYLTASQKQRLKKAAFGHKTPHRARIRAQVVLHADAGSLQCPDSGKRVFWIVDNGSSHRGTRAAGRLAAAFPNAALVHPLPTLHG
ncbi:hypothetical protein ACWGGS_28840 [Streptomyces decoyicus]